jgi:hypothetical protein
MNRCTVMKPMLYPLSYEGYLVRSPCMPDECWSVGLGLAASLTTVYAAPVPRAAGQLFTPWSSKCPVC